MLWSLIVSVHAQARDRTQKTLRRDIRPHFAGGYCRLKKFPKCGFKSLIKVRRQSVESRVPRMQGLSQPAFGSYESRVTLQPSSQRLTWPMLGCEIVGGSRTSINLMTKDCRDEVGALWEVTIDSANANAGLLCDFPNRSVHS
jgi:hypothetical protein